MKKDSDFIKELKLSSGTPKINSLLVITVTMLLLLNGGRSLGQNNPYAKINYDSVVIYDFEWRNPLTKEFISIIDTVSGALAPTVKKSARLDQKTASQLRALLGTKKSYGQGVAACFEPHLGIVFYRSGKYVAYINVCMSCNRLESSLKIPAQDQGKQQEGDDVYYTLYGMSKSLRRYLNGLLAENNFSHQILPGSSFD